ncbi:hypothetical protein HY025_01335 [Candidatus Daviesbacteria bacterium]|nr:hypothetical protein [Candidatus Daviesbacteria bacterium]
MKAESSTNKFYWVRTVQEVFGGRRFVDIPVGLDEVRRAVWSIRNSNPSELFISSGINRVTAAGHTPLEALVHQRTPLVARLNNQNFQQAA